MSKRKAKKPAVKVVVTQATMPDHKRGLSQRTKILLLVVAGLALIALMTGTVMYALHNPTSSITQADKNKAKPKPLSSEQYDTQYNEHVNAGDTKATISFVNDHNDGNPSRRRQLVFAYLNDQQFDNAFKVADEPAVASRLSAVDYQTLAEAADQAHKDQPALKYYKAALAGLKGSSSEYGDRQEAHIQQRINELSR